MLYGSRYLWLLCVLLLASALGTAYGDNVSPQPILNESGLLQGMLREKLQKAVEASERLEQQTKSLLLQMKNLTEESKQQQNTIENLQNEIDESQALLRKQSETLNWQSQMLLNSLNSSIASSASWTLYSQEAESEIQNQNERAARAEQASRRNRLIWQIGIPVGIIIGLGGGYVAGR